MICNPIVLDDLGPNNSEHRLKHVGFSRKVTINDNKSIMPTYDSGVDGNYLSEADRVKAGLPILQRSTKRVGVANGSASRGKHVTKLPFPQLSPKAAQADSFDDLPDSLK